MNNLKLKIITGFDDEQKYTIDAEEAHKAYYLFNHPEERGTFNSGLAIIGKFIQAIQPDYNATMGWNKTYIPDDNDWEIIRAKGIDNKLRDFLQKGKKLSEIITDRSLLKLSLNELDNDGKKLLCLPENNKDIQEQIKQQISKCSICKGEGFVIVTNENGSVAKPCICQKPI